MLLNPAVTASELPEERRHLLGEIPLTEKKFSTRYQRKYIAWVDFGKPDTQQAVSAPVRIPVLDDFFWSVES